jgi:hypothetical protein
VAARSWRGAAIALLGLVIVAAAQFASCGGDEDPGGTSAPIAAGGDLLQDSWMFYVAQDLTRLKPFEGATGDAWLTFYHNDLGRSARQFASSCTPSEASLADRAAAGFPCVGMARSHLELAEFFALAAVVDQVTLRQFQIHRDDNPDKVLPSVHADYFAGVNLLQSGARDEGLARLTAYAANGGADPMLAALAGRIGDGLIDGDPLVSRIWGGSAEDAEPGATLGDLPASEATSNYRSRLAFIEAVACGEIERAESLQRPIRDRDADLREELVQQGGEAPAIDPIIHHHDPTILLVLSRYHAHKARTAAGGAADLAVLTAQADRLLGRAASLPEGAPSVADGLALVIFSAVPTPADLVAAERAWPVPVSSVRRLAALSPALGTQPTSDLSDLDAFTDGSNSLTFALGELMNAASEHGGNLDADMGLSERFRGHLLRERAVQFQEGFDVRLDVEQGADMASAGVAARSLLELALDKNPAPPNPELRSARISYLNDPPLLVALARAELDTKRPGEANDYIRPLTGVYPQLVPVRDALTILDTAWNPPTKDGASAPRSQ